MSRLEVEAGRRIAYEYHKGTETPVLLIHGWGATRRAWDPVLPALLAAGHAVVSFDQRCCGESDKDFELVTIDAVAGDAVRLCGELGLERVAVNGWSLGGAVAVATAHRLGTRCAGVISTAGATPRYTAAAHFPHGGTVRDVRATIDALGTDRIAVLAQIAAAISANPTEGTTQWFFGMLMQMSPAGDAIMLDLASTDQCAILRELDVPFLSIVGGRDSFVTPDAGRAAAQMAREGRVVECPDAGHAPFVEDARTYQAALLNFLEKIS